MTEWMQGEECSCSSRRQHSDGFLEVEKWAPPTMLHRGLAEIVAEKPIKLGEAKRSGSRS